MQKFAMLNVYFREQHSHSSRYGFLCGFFFFWGGGEVHTIQVSFFKTNEMLEDPSLT